MTTFIHVARVVQTRSTTVKRCTHCATVTSRRKNRDIPRCSGNSQRLQMVAYWITDQGYEKPLGAMSNDHISACIRFLEAGRMLRPGCNGLSNYEWLLVFRAELIRRARYSFA